MRCDLRPGDYRVALADVGEVDAVICDPPFSARTHVGNSDMQRFAAMPRQDTRRNLSYAHWTPSDVREFVAHWAPRTKGWMVCITSDDLILVWREAYAATGRLDFAAVPILSHRARLTGDGPASSACYLMAARPRRKEFLSWGSLPGFYGPFHPFTQEAAHIGGKPVSLMRAIVRDYSRPGDLVCDPCAGLATTAIAALQEGRRFVGAELDLATHHKAIVRLSGTNLAPPLLQVEWGEQLQLGAE